MNCKVKLVFYILVVCYRFFFVVELSIYFIKFLILFLCFLIIFVLFIILNIFFLYFCGLVV